MKGVSRSFYLTLRVLPGKVRNPISLAYLLARATDTIADTHLVAVRQRQKALSKMREAIFAAAEGRTAPPPDFGELAAAQAAPAGRGSPAERALLAGIDEALAALRGLSEQDRLRIRDALDTITRGQEMDLLRFAHSSSDQIVALNSDQELDEYIYCVAGCVGEFWTKICRAHLFPAAELDDAFLLRSGVRLGKGLQLVNILRDLPNDLRQGRCYLPAPSLEACGLRPQDLLSPLAMERFRPLYEGYLKQTEEHLAAGWEYTKTLPRGQVRVRLACAWPILIGAKTLARLRAGNVLDQRTRIKISRSEIRLLVLDSILRYPFPAAWNRLFDAAKMKACTEITNRRDHDRVELPQ